MYRETVKRQKERQSKKFETNLHHVRVFDYPWDDQLNDAAAAAASEILRRRKNSILIQSFSELEQIIVIIYMP